MALKRQRTPQKPQRPSARPPLTGGPSPGIKFAVMPAIASDGRVPMAAQRRLTEPAFMRNYLPAVIARRQ